MTKNIFFWGDLHIGHSNAYKFQSATSDKRMREFYHIDHAEQLMIDNYNAIVKTDDIVYFLGDICFGKERGASVLSKMVKGSKHLIMGNHDNKGDISFYREYFDKVYGVLYLPRIKCILSHIPVHPIFLGPQVHLNNETRFNFNITGHTHDYHIRKEGKKDPAYLNSCVEVVNYKPVTFEQLKIINQKYN